MYVRTVREMQIPARGLAHSALTKTPNGVADAKRGTWSKHFRPSFSSRLQPYEYPAADSGPATSHATAGEKDPYVVTGNKAPLAFDAGNKAPFKHRTNEWCALIRVYSYARHTNHRGRENKVFYCFHIRAVACKCSHTQARTCTLHLLC